MRLQSRPFVFPLILFLLTVCVNPTDADPRSRIEMEIIPSTWCLSSFTSYPFRLTDIVYTGNSNFVAVNLSSGFARSTDAGLTWSGVASADGRLRSVSFGGPEIGVAVGNDGLILRTTNGGVFWEPVGAGITENLRDVYLNGIESGTAVGESGGIFTTTDGGISWSRNPYSVSTILNAIDFLDDQYGIIAGSSVLLQTKDGGTVWESIPTTMPVRMPVISVLDSTRSVAVGVEYQDLEQEDGVIYQSVDGGISWINRLRIPNAQFLDVDFFNANLGLAAYGRIVFTEDGGESWDVISGETTGLTSVDFSNIDRAIAGSGNPYFAILDRICLRLDLIPVPAAEAVQINWTVRGTRTTDGVRLLRVAPDSSETWIPADSVLTGTAGSCFDEDVIVGSEYSYTLVAYQGVTELTRSLPRLGTAIPNPVVNLAATPQTGAIRLDWSTDPAAVADSFRVLRDNPDSSQTLIPADTALAGSILSLGDDAVDPGMDYRYTVVAYPRPNHEVRSQSVTASPFGAVDITDFRAAPSTNNVRLYWGIEPELDPYITAIRLIRRQAGTWEIWLPIDGILLPGSRSFTDFAVEPATQYSYCLVLQGVPNREIRSGFIDVTTVAVPEITSFSAVSTGTEVVMKWDIDSEDIVRGYQIRRNCGDGSQIWIPPDTVLGPGTRSVVDEDVETGQTYDYTLCVLLAVGGSTFTEPKTVTIDAVPTETALGQNFPNPFNPGTAIPFSLTQKTWVTIEVFDTAGRRVRTVLDGYRERGYRSEQWDGTNDRGSPAPSGVYFCRMKAGDYTATRKMVLLR